MVHLAAGYARQRNRLGAYACTTSVGPGATNMVTGAALATINRLPVLLLPSDTFATRAPHPVLQQLESPHDATLSVNDCFRPVSRFFDRVERPEQLVSAALEAMRVLTDPAETGAATLALPEDVQTEAVEVPKAFLEPRVWTVYRRPPAPEALARAAELVRAARRPLIVAGGGVIYSEATDALAAFAGATGIPVGETQAGRGALRSDHPSSLGAIGATGTAAANRLARDADLVIGIGTRWSDFTTASNSAFQDPDVRFVNINVAAFDAAKRSGLAVEADARLALEELQDALADHRVDPEWSSRAASESAAWAAEVERLVTAGHQPLPSQAEVIGAVNDAAGENGVVVCAAGSMPGDLHKLWRARDPKGYHVEYGYSCMGYEIPGGMGVKLAAPEREVFVMIGDGSYLMLPGDLATAVAEEIKLVIILVQNHGYASIGALSRSVGSAGFGTLYHSRANGSVATDEDPSDPLAIDLAANAESLGAKVLRARTIDDVRSALAAARDADGPVVVHVEVDRYAGVPSYESWWDVPVAEISSDESVRAAREEYERNRQAQRTYVAPPHDPSVVTP
jgi:3D-(3,5/4)-trihydroxycyclohexane-1,2-dione acylhydrolase (decyclizing)